MFDGLWNLIAGLLDKLGQVLPSWQLGLDLGTAFSTIVDVIELVGYMFPPVRLIAKLLGIWLGLELALWALFVINWLLKKIPFIGG